MNEAIGISGLKNKKTNLAYLIVKSYKTLKLTSKTEQIEHYNILSEVINICEILKFDKQMIIEYLWAEKWATIKMFK